MNTVALVGFGSIGAAVASLVAARRSHWYVVAFAFACAVAAACAFLADLWVFGIAGILTYLVAMRRWIDMHEGYGQGNAHAPSGQALRPRLMKDGTFTNDSPEGDRR